eukprot:scaffold1309_cov214-Chaetoceros_neogracile.AAC.15
MTTASVAARSVIEKIILHSKSGKRVNTLLNLEQFILTQFLLLKRVRGRLVKMLRVLGRQPLVLSRLNTTVRCS